MCETLNLVKDEIEYVYRVLEYKNKMYGDSIFTPIGVFAKNANAIDLINIRLDDKLARLKQGHTDDVEDTELDIIGYLILKRVCRKSKNEL